MRFHNCGIENLAAEEKHCNRREQKDLIVRLTSAKQGIAGQIPELSRSEEGTQETTGEVGTQAAEELPVSQREYELLKREKELLERELRLERRKREMLSTSSIATSTSVAPTLKL